MAEPGAGSVYKILTYDNISVAGLERLPRDRYEVASEIQHPDAILLRSHDLHGVPIPESLKAVGRAGAGVNNIPVSQYSERGIPVFNAPGANANAVKELVIGGMLLACRNICRAWDFVNRLEGGDEALHAQMEKGKKQFAGFELAGKTLGILGLGAIGVRVANAAVALGMNVIGYDPLITVDSAWQLSATVAKASSVDDLIARVDFLTLHVPLNDQTRKLINSARISLMKRGAVLLNFSRAGIVDEESVCAALDAGRLYAYVCDFPSNRLQRNPCVIALPHLGASTREAEDNCAIMVAERVRDYLENGNIKNAVNFPDVIMPRTEGYRLGIANANVPNMVGQISGCLAEVSLNIVDLLNKSKGEVAYTLIDVSEEIPMETLEKIHAIDGVLSARVI
jgi:D-3-phosphoglycerate dehydrogenase